MTLNVGIIVRLRQTVHASPRSTSHLRRPLNVNPSGCGSRVVRYRSGRRAAADDVRNGSQVDTETGSLALTDTLQRLEQRSSSCQQVAAELQQSRQRRLTRMLLLVSLTWLVLTAPFALHSIVSVFQGDESTNSARNFLVKTICFLLVYVNHAVNFYLYCLTGRRFRLELRALFCYRRRFVPSTAARHRFRSGDGRPDGGSRDRMPGASCSRVPSNNSSSVRNNNSGCKKSAPLAVDDAVL